MKNYSAYTDGAYSPTRDQGGIGLVILNENNESILEYSKSYNETTNSRMEIQAVICALKCIKKPIDSFTIYSDSQYVVNTINKDWKIKANQDLWTELKELLNKIPCKNVKFVWVKGHSTNELNNKVDKLAVRASQTI